MKAIHSRILIAVALLSGLALTSARAADVTLAEACAMVARSDGDRLDRGGCEEDWNQIFP